MVQFIDVSDAEFVQECQEFLKELRNSNDWIEAKTSGSTGVPKQIRINKNAAFESAKITNQHFGLKKDSVFLVCISPKFIGGKMMLVRAELLGAKVIALPPAKLNLSLLGGLIVDFAAMVPSQLYNLLQQKEQVNFLNQVKQLIIGGAPVSESLRTEIIKLKTECYSTYGMTETISHIALMNLSRKEKFYSCLKGWNISLNVDGCLIVHKNKVLSKDVLTNDVIELIGENQFIWKGRNDFVINSGGIKIHPEEMERKLSKFFDSNEFYFSGESDNKWGERLVLNVEGEFDPAIESFLLSIFNDYFDSVHTPKEIRFMPQFHRTPSGKIKR